MEIHLSVSFRAHRRDKSEFAKSTIVYKKLPILSLDKFMIVCAFRRLNSLRGAVVDLDRK